MKKRILSLVLALCLAVALLPGMVLARGNTAVEATGAPGRVLAALKDSPYTFAGGSGTMDDPYLISTPDQLNAIRKGLDKHYKLTCDIDLSSWGDWMPIGGEVLERHGDPLNFSGSLDGAGHVIKGMTITGKPFDYEREDQAYGFEAHYFGLFASIKCRDTNVNPSDADNDTTLGGVFNLGMVDYNINLDTDFEYSFMRDPTIGSIAGIVGNARIVNCWSKDGVAKVSNTEHGYIGGIVGEARYAAIRQCWNNSALTGAYVGGIANEANSVWISHCFNAGTLKASDLAKLEAQASGIASGQAWSIKDGDGGETRIMYCYNAGSLSGYMVVGIGKADFLDNIYNAGSLVGESVNPISVGSPKLGIAHNGERYLKDENWTDSPTLGRKVLTALREDQLVSGGSSAAANVGGFSDVKTTDFFADAVIWAIGRGITKGTSNTTFSPGNTCTKAEAITFIHRTELEPSYWGFSSEERVTFLKVNPDWFDSFYYLSAQWAFDEGMITSGTRMADPCTRADFVTYLWKTAGSPKTQTINQFTDVPVGAAYAQAVAWAVQNGVTNGVGDGTKFDPNGTCTRGQIVTFLNRAYKNA